AGIDAARRDRPRTVGGAEAGEEDELARAYDGAGVAERHGACGRYDFLADFAAGPHSDHVYLDEPAHDAEVARGQHRARGRVLGERRAPGVLEARQVRDVGQPDLRLDDVLHRRPARRQRAGEILQDELGLAPDRRAFPEDWVRLGLGWDAGAEVGRHLAREEQVVTHAHDRR